MKLQQHCRDTELFGLSKRNERNDSQADIGRRISNTSGRMLVA